MMKADEEERTVVGLVGDEEAVASFLLAGWGQRRNDNDLICNWISVHENTCNEELERSWYNLIKSKRLAVILVSGSVVLRLDTLMDEHIKSGKPPTVVALPSGSALPRVTCSVYEPYAGWRSEIESKETITEELSSAITNICGGSMSKLKNEQVFNQTDKTKERPQEEIEEEIKIDKNRGRRVDALVDAIFRLATLDVARGEEDEHLFKDVQPGWDGSTNPTSRRSKGSASAARGFKLQILNAATTELAEILQISPRGAKHFVRALNRQRTRMVDVGAAFPFLAGLSLTVLDKCMATSDVDAILTSMMLAQSFYRSRQNNQKNEENQPAREYLKSAIQSHPVWSDVAFWRDALTVCVDKQRRDLLHEPSNGKPRPPPSPLLPASSNTTPLYALCLPIGLRPDYSEAAAQHQVALWSQLGGIVHAMLEFGVDCAQVRSFVQLICDEHNLAAPQRAAILDHIKHVEHRNNTSSGSNTFSDFFSSFSAGDDDKDTTAPSTPILTTGSKVDAATPIQPAVAY
uniref:Uncharacterized protein n=1 Tax=Aureoumbra lagunensis TaxID=44058 RepID=A0A7S3NP14_9STRA|mmetsp:Transcript_16849/g.25362  ORF Transcript_16849/g.25362 Transcript_16849/m.25362 type:complete len:518 (-) Transcript_16849:158-1711(-)